LRGIVILPDGRRARGAAVHVNLVRTNSVERVFGFADEHGAFELPLPPAALHESRMFLVMLHHSGTPRNVFPLSDAQVDAPPEELRMTAARLSGRVVDLHGRPIEWATVDILADTPPVTWFADGEPDLLVYPSPRTGPDGRFGAVVQCRDWITVVCRARDTVTETRRIPALERPTDLGTIALAPAPSIPPARPPLAAAR
jgi:hypothetical protein